MIRVFITDDHEIYLEGLALLLSKQEGIEVIGTAASGKDLLALVPGLQADVLLLDVYLPDMGEEEILQQIFIHLRARSNTGETFIQEHYPVQDLLSLSLASKTFNRIVRPMMFYALTPSFLTYRNDAH